ncbi:glycosyltransferase family 2 protein [Aerococcus urinaeequi]|uniref:Glycosyltransferase family 2 protein n=1 Tax=Aerococcus urinaeequi TaxID=51665 RepID=A0AAE9XIU1_9LACT|nr:glycosyltransferase family 2 protein [Aerococcus urinaeequi]WCG37237.1 glycosyltransferase family 2 protein [Aerococcus urinaeequi]
MKLFFIIFIVALFIIFWGNIGYQLSLILIGKLTKKKNKKTLSYFPEVTIMVVAHNEEKVILEKLNNLSKIDYPKEKLKIIVASDNSTDRTNDIVKNYSKSNESVELFIVKARKGKTNAQNEAQKSVDSEILVMTDANAMLHPKAIIELVSSFASDDICYVSGKLEYTNGENNQTSENESKYWGLELKVREIESNIQTITAGNGALYAVRNKDYVDFSPIESHDSSMPIYYALQGKRAIANHDAIAYEKAGENIEDEFNRKVRMNRVLLLHILPSISIFNFIKYKWFSYFYFGHRTCRYLLWAAHIMLFISNFILSFVSPLFMMLLLLHTSFIMIALLQQFLNTNFILFRFIHYYSITIYAQVVGVFYSLTGKSKPFWEKAESTR